MVMKKESLLQVEFQIEMAVEKEIVKEIEKPKRILMVIVKQI